MDFIPFLTNKDIFIILKKHYFKFYDRVRITDSDVIKFKNGYFFVHITYRNNVIFNIYILKRIDNKCIIHESYYTNQLRNLTFDKFNNYLYKILPNNIRKHKLSKIILSS